MVTPGMYLHGPDSLLRGLQIHSAYLAQAKGTVIVQCMHAVVAHAVVAQHLAKL